MRRVYDEVRDLYTWTKKTYMYRQKRCIYINKRDTYIWNKSDLQKLNRKYLYNIPT